MFPLITYNLKNLKINRMNLILKIFSLKHKISEYQNNNLFIFTFN